MSEKRCCGVLGSPTEVHKWSVGYWAFWVGTSLINKGQVGCWMTHIHIRLGNVHATTSRVMAPAEISFLMGCRPAGVAHGDAQMKQKLLRIIILRGDIAHRSQMVNRTWVTVNESSYMRCIHGSSQNECDMGSRGRPWRCTNEAKTLTIHHFELQGCDSAGRW